jgi:hypothetical protein
LTSFSSVLSSFTSLFFFLSSSPSSFTSQDALGQKKTTNNTEKVFLLIIDLAVHNLSRLTQHRGYLLARVSSFAWHFFSVLSEMSFANIVPVSNENENDQRILGCAGFAWNLISVVSETVFANIVPVSNENENEQRTLGCADFAWNLITVLSETVFAHIFPVSNKNKNERSTLLIALSQFLSFSCGIMFSCIN